MKTNEFGLDVIEDTFSNEYRVCGSIPTNPKLMMATPLYFKDIIPLSEIKEFEIDPPGVMIKDQSNKGACNGHAMASGMEVARAVAGMTYTALSAWYPYAIMCNGVDLGSNILDAFTLAQERGICREEDFPYGEISPKVINEQHNQIAQRYRMEFGGRLSTFEMILSAIARMEPVNFALRVGPNFNNLDKEGVPGFTKGPCNHAVLGYGGIKFSKTHGPLFKVRNSWSPKWGWGGCCWVGRKFIEAEYFEAYMVSTMYYDPNDPTNPPWSIHE